MSDLERFNQLVDDIWEMVFGTERRPKPKKRPRRHKKNLNKDEKRMTKKYRRQGR